MAEGTGRDAEIPSEIPARGWRDVLRRGLCRTLDDGLLTEAAGVAFYAVLALFAGLAAFVAFWGVLADPGILGQRVRDTGGALPAGLPEMLERILAEAAGPGRGTAALLAAVWAASGAAQALIRGLNLVYGERECRGFWALTGLSLVVSLFGALFAVLALAAFLALPLVSGDGSAAAAVNLLRWPALITVVTIGLAALYRYGACRTAPRWQWVSWGSAVAAVAWVLGSAGFSWYVRQTGGYGAAYGPLSAVVVFMTWVWLSSAAVLVGGVLNAEAEGQTARDTTAGPSRPAGHRGAAKADMVGDAPDGVMAGGHASARSGTTAAVPAAEPPVRRDAAASPG